MMALTKLTRPGDGRASSSSRDVTKSYAGIRALDGVGFAIREGEAVSLAGENGSGKSTLIKILAGVEEPDAAQHHRRRRALRAADAAAVGGGGDHGDLPGLLALPEPLGRREHRLQRRAARRPAAGRSPAGAGAGGADAGAGRASTSRSAARVETLSVAHKQLVAICRALASDARLIIMDEPTTALTEREVRVLLGIIRRLKADGVAVLFVSHKLAEVLEVCEHVVVLRNGRKVAEGPAAEFDAASLTRHMTGRDVAETPPAPLAPGAPRLLEVRGLVEGRRVRGHRLRPARRRGARGLRACSARGAPRSPRRSSGWSRPTRAASTLDGRAVPLGDPLGAAAAGIGYVPEDRLTEGLFLTQSILRNVGDRADGGACAGAAARPRRALGRGGGVAAAAWR